MNESELYKELGKLTKDKDKWKDSIPFVSNLLTYKSLKIQAKALWLLGEMGLDYPSLIKDSVSEIAPFCNNKEPILRERAVIAIGRIDRFIHLVKSREDLLAEFDPRLWVTMVENVKIMNNGKMLFRFYDGTEIYG